METFRRESLRAMYQEVGMIQSPLSLVKKENLTVTTSQMEVMS